MERNRKVLSYLLWLVVVASIGIVCYFVSGIVVRKLAQDDLTHYGHMIASSISPSRLNSLLGSSKDKDNPNHKWLVEQFVHMGAIYPEIRYIYLLGQTNDKKIFFYIDSQPERFDLKDAPPLAEPGEIYEDENPEFAKVFESTGPIIWPPTTDKWGTFVSLTMPLADKELEKKAILGIDVDAKLWGEQISNAQVWPAISSTVIIVLLMAFIRGVRANYLASKKIQDNERLVSSIIDVVSDAIVMVDEGGKTVVWNKAATEIFGYLPDEVLDKKFMEGSITPGNTREISAKRKDGTQITIELTVTRTKKDDKWYSVGVIRDVTARKQGEVEAQKHEQELEKMNRLMIDRELKMVELKKQIKQTNV